MIAADSVLFLASFVLWLYCVFDAITADPARVRNLPKLLWVAITIVLNVVGSVLWLVAGRPRPASGGLRAARGQYLSPRGNPGPGRASSPRGRDRPLAPDDDPEFLASLDRRQKKDDGDPPHEPA